MKRSEIVPVLLEILQRGTETTAALIGAMSTDYAESQRRIGRLNRYGTPPFDADWGESYRERQRFSKLLNRLREDGIIANEGKRHRAIWRLTAKGIERLKHLKLKRKIPIPKYERKRDGKWRVVMYDVPEREREKRAWVRRALLSLGFEFLQESVWVGTIAIPRTFLDDLRAMEMFPYVQIFEVSRRGTITLVK
ncbi:MAG: CRISPR-associated endonuclease Cas2 [Candidatus Jorgensenbacteria bacterium]|nr:CRISPR-associated endonuclease Cas2 [Candidatus Jorgensenbacteria bacterium]